MRTELKASFQKDDGKLRDSRSTENSKLAGHKKKIVSLQFVLDFLIILSFHFAGYVQYLCNLALTDVIAGPNRRLLLLQMTTLCLSNLVMGRTNLT